MLTTNQNMCSAPHGNHDLFYGILSLPFGAALIGGTASCVTFLRLGDRDSDFALFLDSLKKDRELLAAENCNPDLARLWRNALENYVCGATPHVDLALAPSGTVFQKQVWRLLTDIPRGETASYKDIATRMNKSDSFRAVAQACAKNPIALAIPCHRVISHSGSLSGYAWGVARKKEILDFEKNTPCA